MIDVAAAENANNSSNIHSNRNSHGFDESLRYGMSTTTGMSVASIASRPGDDFAVGGGRVSDGSQGEGGALFQAPRRDGMSGGSTILAGDSTASAATSQQRDSHLVQQQQQQPQLTGEGFNKPPRDSTGSFASSTADQQQDAAASGILLEAAGRTSSGSGIVPRSSDSRNSGVNGGGGSSSSSSGAHPFVENTCTGSSDSGSSRFALPPQNRQNTATFSELPKQSQIGQNNNSNSMRPSNSQHGSQPQQQQQEFQSTNNDDVPLFPNTANTISSVKAEVKEEESSARSSRLSVVEGSSEHLEPQEQQQQQDTMLLNNSNVGGGEMVDDENADPFGEADQLFWGNTNNNNNNEKMNNNNNVTGSTNDAEADTLLVNRVLFDGADDQQLQQQQHQEEVAVSDTQMDAMLANADKLDAALLIIPSAQQQQQRAATNNNHSVVTVSSDGSGGGSGSSVLIVDQSTTPGKKKSSGGKKSGNNNTNSLFMRPSQADSQFVPALFDANNINNGGSSKKGRKGRNNEESNNTASTQFVQFNHARWSDENDDDDDDVYRCPNDDGDGSNESSSGDDNDDDDAARKSTTAKSPQQKKQQQSPRQSKAAASAASASASAASTTLAAVKPEKENAQQRLIRDRFRICVARPLLKVPEWAELHALILRLGGSVVTSVDDCTHYITDKVSKIENTITAIAAGRWLVHPQFVLDSSKQQRWLHEEPFEWTQEFYRNKMVQEDEQRKKTMTDAERLERPAVFQPMNSNMTLLLEACRFQRRNQMRQREENKRAGHPVSDGVGPFRGWRAVILHDFERGDAFRRILVAGGCEGEPAVLPGLWVELAAMDKRILQNYTHVLFDSDKKGDAAAAVIAGGATTEQSNAYNAVKSRVAISCHLCRLDVVVSALTPERLDYSKFSAQAFSGRMSKSRSPAKMPAAAAGAMLRNAAAPVVDPSHLIGAPVLAAARNSSAAAGAGGAAASGNGLPRDSGSRRQRDEIEIE